MTSPISRAMPSQLAAPVNTAAKASASKGASKVDGDGDHDGPKQAAGGKTQVTISAAGQLAAAANKEAMETPAQTAQEAQGTDMQAKRLLAKEQAAAKATQA